jgi:hypothetical protein
VIRAEQDLPGTEGGRGKGRRVGWRNDPNNVCTCEKMNKKKQAKKKDPQCFCLQLHMHNSGLPSLYKKTKDNQI